MSERISIDALRVRADTDEGIGVKIRPSQLLALVEAVEALSLIAERGKYAKSTEDISDVWRTFRAINDAREGPLSRFDFGGAA